MRFANHAGRTVLVRGEEVADLNAASGGRLTWDPAALFDEWDDVVQWDGSLAAATWLPLDPGRLGPVVPAPRQVFGVALNYVDHAAETGRPLPEHPLVFTKFPTCITGPTADVVLPSDRCDWEAELVVVIGRRAHRVDRDEAWEHVAGLTVGQDVSERDLQYRGPSPHFCVAKSFPTFGPVGPVLVTPDELVDRDDLPIRCTVNGETMQDGGTSDLVFPVAELVATISASVVMLPGDLVFTGTPAGVGWRREPPRYLAPGDVVETTIDGIGTMRNRCTVG